MAESMLLAVKNSIVVWVNQEGKASHILGWYL